MKEPPNEGSSPNWRLDGDGGFLVGLSDLESLIEAASRAPWLSEWMKASQAAKAAVAG